MKAMNVSGPSQVSCRIPPLRMTQLEKKLLVNLILCLRSQEKKINPFHNEIRNAKRSEFI